MSNYDGRGIFDKTESQENVTSDVISGAISSPSNTKKIGDEMECSPTGKKHHVIGSAGSGSISPRASGLSMRSWTFPDASRRPSSGCSLFPPAKRIKIEQKPDDPESLKSYILQWKKEQIESIKASYNNNVAELFFLNHQGNMADFQSWLKKPTEEYIAFARQHCLPGDDTLEKRLAALNNPVVTVKSEFPSPSKVSSNDNSTPKSSRSEKTNDGKPSQDQMVEKARQEAHVMARIASLRKEGLWGEKRLPKVQEPPRPKAHWDYLLEEMVWLSADFAQERKWKKAAAKKCAKMVQKYFQDKELQAQKAERDQELRIRKIAGFIAKEVRTFWGNVEKLLEYKVNTHLDEKKKEALDQQLSFIVDQTEKYSSMLAEGMKKPICTTPNGSAAPSINSGSISPSSRVSDVEFEPEEPSDDDEATIAREDDNPEEQETELELLKKESEQTMEDFLSELPPGYLDEKVADSNDVISEELDNSKVVPQESVSVASDSDIIRSRRERRIVRKSIVVDDKISSDVKSSDRDFDAEMEDETDDETTIQEQEALEGQDNEELEDLQAENEMSVEELKKKYMELASGAEPMEESESSADDNVESDKDDSDADDVSLATLQENKKKLTQEEHEESDSDDSSESETEVQSDDENKMDLESLMKDDLIKDHSEFRKEKADKQLQDATAVAESLQPKGFTLSSTQVTTPIPVLLKHTLREYQHVGLDWLVTMYEKKLNGILADEMGLGKTIQTISLLAHLACEKGSWGPHLIVVPTSVMLNWEMEFKKWCPAFKILTYYGSIKERKLKRQGWTKQNAFHVCITSYKLVIQDHQSFRRKKWKYFILDEAQNIKNFKSQRWQLLLNFQSQRRLLLTGTPLQNNLMELWSLMHFLMPQVFASHKEFREWFSNPVSGMIEGNKDYNENIIKRLHKVLRPFILRRLKTEVEQQMPKKFEHIVMCRLSKRQRHLYEEFMSRTKTKETLLSGNFLSVINILMQLRKVCNHPNLFEPRPIFSPLMTESLVYSIPSIVWGVTDYDPYKHIDLFSLNLRLIDLEVCLTAFVAHRIRKCYAPTKLIEEIDNSSDPPPKCPAGKIKLHVRPSNQTANRTTTNNLGLTRPVVPGNTMAAGPRLGLAQVPGLGTNAVTTQASGTPGWTSGLRFQLIQQGGTLKAIPMPVGSSGGMVVQQTPQGPRLVVQPRPAAPAAQAAPTNSQSSGLQLVQTSTGHLVITSLGISGNAASALLQKLQNFKGFQGSVITTGAGGRPVLRLPTSSLRPNLQVRTPGSVAGSPTIATDTASSSSSASNSLPFGLNKTVTTLASSNRPSAGNSLSNDTATTTTSSLTMPVSSASSSPVKRSDSVKQVEKAIQQKKDDRKRNLFLLNDLEEKRKLKRKEKLSLIASLNIRRCHACPIYGSDLVEALSIVHNNNPSQVSIYGNEWLCGQGLSHTIHITQRKSRYFWHQTDSLNQIINTPVSMLEKLKHITNNFAFTVPAVMASAPQIRIHHPPPSKLWRAKHFKHKLSSMSSPLIAPLHSLINSSMTQFPDVRLIQYDCGKLQTLDHLLRKLKTGGHRVLIFTQMTRMLDVFEAFLNYHGHIYLRLDGSTKVEQRQVLMERFNQDKRIFVFILSTRSGGIGVNLTGADTVVFYDSDWNPTMDAQAQDRCHRIGQTRDVHIYRLISEKTVEENILKKANQKRMLGDLAIEGGNFTTAFFKKQTINDLFQVNEQERDASKRMSEVVQKGEHSNPEVDSEKMKMGAFENALAAAEDESDVQAAKTAKAEAAADLAEFDENIPIDEGEEMSRAEQEVATLMKQLTPVEKYAMKFLESCDDGLAAEAERMAAEIEQQKKDWEIERIKALKSEEERQAYMSDEDLVLSPSSDAQKKVWMNLNNLSIEEMPIWQPPTPPPDDNDIYTDTSLLYWYDNSVMSESALPPIYIKKEHKRFKPDPGAITGDTAPSLRCSSQKLRREDSSYAPRSLFDRPTAQVAKLRRDLKLQKSHGIVRSTLPVTSLKSQQMLSKPIEMDNIPEWMPHEDTLIQNTLQQILQMPANLVSLSPSIIPNWDLIADMTNSNSKCYRSAKLCRARYEQKILQREELKGSSSDLSQKKLYRKIKSGSSGKSQEQSNLSSLLSTRYETIKSIFVKRTPTTKPMFINSTVKNPKHAQVLADSGINYEAPLSASQVAANRAERILKEKKQNAEMQQQHRLHQLQQQQPQQQQTQQQQLQHVQSSQNAQTVSILNGSNIASSGQQVIVSGANAVKTISTSVVLTQGGNTISGGSVVSSSSIPISSNPVASVANVVGTTSGIISTIRAAATASSGARTTLALQEFPGRTSQATVVSVSSLAQLQASKFTSLTSQPHQKGVSGMQMQTRTLTAQQLQYLRQQAIQQHQSYAIQQSKSGTSTEPATFKRVQIAAQPGNAQKIQVAVSGGTVPAITAIQVSQAGRAQILKSGTVATVGTASSSAVTTSGAGTLVTSKALTRTVTESEMNALLRRQNQPKAGQVAQVRNMLTSKRSLVGVKGPTVGLQLGGKTVGSSNVSTVQIVQGGTVHPKHMTIQQVFKQVQPQGTTQHIQAGTVIGKSGASGGLAGGSTSGVVVSQGGTLGTSQNTKILPGTVIQQQPLKQTIQVVSAGSTVVGSSGPSAIRVSSGDRSGSSIASIQGNTVKVTNPTLISHMNAALQGQNLPVRIHTSTLSSQHLLQQQQQQQQQNNQNQ